MSPWHRHLAAVLLLALPACGGPGALDQARTAFWSWHGAMQRGDRDAVRRLITFGSRDYIDSVRFDRAQSGAAVRIQRERLDGNQAVLQVSEQNAQDAPQVGSYVLV